MAACKTTLYNWRISDIRLFDVDLNKIDIVEDDCYAFFHTFAILNMAKCSMSTGWRRTYKGQSGRHLGKGKGGSAIVVKSKQAAGDSWGHMLAVFLRPVAIRHLKKKKKKKWPNVAIFMSGKCTCSIWATLPGWNLHNTQVSTWKCAKRSIQIETQQMWRRFHAALLWRSAENPACNEAVLSTVENETDLVAALFYSCCPT